MVVTASVFRPKLSTPSKHTENGEHAATNSIVLASPSSDTESPNSQIDPGSLSREKLRVEVRRRDVQIANGSGKLRLSFMARSSTRPGSSKADVRFQWRDPPSLIHKFRERSVFFGQLPHYPIVMPDATDRMIDEPRAENGQAETQRQ